MNALRQISPVLTAARKAGQTDTGTTRELLKALSAHEGNSDLGLLAHALLHAGPYLSTATVSEIWDALEYAQSIEAHAEAIAEECRETLEFDLEGAA